MKSFSYFFFGIGAFVGCIVSSFFVQFSTPFNGFIFTGTTTALVTLGAIFTPDEVETNKYAMQARDFEKHEFNFVKQQRPDSFISFSDDKDLTIYQRFIVKFYIIKHCF